MGFTPRQSVCMMIGVCIAHGAGGRCGFVLRREVSAAYTINRRVLDITPEHSKHSKRSGNRAFKIASVTHEN